MIYELFDEETARKQYDTARSIQDIEKGRAEGIEKMISAMRASGLTEEQIEAAKKAMS